MSGAEPRRGDCRRPPAVRAGLGVLLGIALLGVPAPAQEAGSGLGEVGLEQLGRETWTPDVGLAGSWVRDIVKAPDGFLWVATSGGLSRFDGRFFVNFTAANEPELPANSVTALAVGSGGRLWVGLDHGGVRVLVAGKLRPEPRLAELAHSAVRALFEAADGTLWIGTQSGLWRAGATGRPSGSRPAPKPSRPRSADWCRSARTSCWCAPTGTESGGSGPAASGPRATRPAARDSIWSARPTGDLSPRASPASGPAGPRATTPGGCTHRWTRASGSSSRGMARSGSRAPRA